MSAHPGSQPPPKNSPEHQSLFPTAESFSSPTQPNNIKCPIPVKLDTPKTGKTQNDLRGTEVGIWGQFVLAELLRTKSHFVCLYGTFIFPSQPATRAASPAEGYDSAAGWGTGTPELTTARPPIFTAQPGPLWLFKCRDV